MNLTKPVQDLYAENHTMLMKESDIKRWRDIVIKDDST